MTTKHDWECISPGMYDTLYECTQCDEKHMESADNPDTYLDKHEDGCTGDSDD